MSTTPKEPEKDKTELTCGIVMPISGTTEYPTDHWVDVLKILTEVITDSGFKPNLVSNSDESGIIQKRIVQNLYNNHLIICDVSSKNPNVMFELGIRLAFDKPTIIVKDDFTDYSFDTSIIEHIGYPKDLRFPKMVHFKTVLKEKILATHKKATEDKNYSTFLKSFGEFVVAAHVPKTEVSSNEFIIAKLDEIQRDIQASKPQLINIKLQDSGLDYRKLSRKQLADIVRNQINILTKANNIEESVLDEDEVLKDHLYSQLHAIGLRSAFSSDSAFKEYVDRQILPF